MIKNRLLKNFVKNLNHYAFPGCVLLSIRIPSFEIESARTVTHIICILKKSFQICIKLYYAIQNNAF